MNIHIESLVLQKIKIFIQFGIMEAQIHQEDYSLKIKRLPDFRSTPVLCAEFSSTDKDQSDVDANLFPANIC